MNGGSDRLIQRVSCVACLLVLIACSGDGSHRSPTEPAPQAPPTSAVSAKALFHLSDYGADPVEINLYYDGRLVRGGAPFTYYGAVFDVWGDLGGEIWDLTPGRHTFTLEVAGPRLESHVSGNVEVNRWRNGFLVQTQGSSWEETAIVGHESVWKGEFVIEEWSS